MCVHFVSIYTNTGVEKKKQKAAREISREVDMLAFPKPCPNFAEEKEKSTCRSLCHQEEKREEKNQVTETATCR